MLLSLYILKLNQFKFLNLFYKMINRLTTIKYNFFICMSYIYLGFNSLVSLGISTGKYRIFDVKPKILPK